MDFLDKFILMSNENNMQHESWYLLRCEAQQHIEHPSLCRIACANQQTQETLEDGRPPSVYLSSSAAPIHLWLLHSAFLRYAIIYFTVMD